MINQKSAGEADRPDTSSVFTERPTARHEDGFARQATCMLTSHSHAWQTHSASLNTSHSGQVMRGCHYADPQVLLLDTSDYTSKMKTS